MGRIVTPLGAGQTFFGRTSRVKLGTGPITTINPIKAIGQGALATAAGVKAIEGVADLTIKGFGAIAKGVAEGKRAAAREALAQDTAAQQGQVDAASSEAGQALGSIPRLQEPDTSDVGTQQFLQSIGLSEPTIGEAAPAGTLFPGEFQATDLLERQQQLRTRPGTANVLATQGAPAPEEAAVDRQVEQIRALGLGQAAAPETAFDLRRGDVPGRQSLLDQQLAAQRARGDRAAGAAPRVNPFADSMVADERARRELARRDLRPFTARLGSIAPELAPSVSPELTQPLRQPFRPTVDLSKLEDLGPLSDRALATYDPGQLIAAAGSTGDPAVLERILRAAQGQARPTSLAELASGEPQRKLDKAIIDQFGKFLPKPEKPLSALDLQRIQESQQRVSASKTRQQLDDARRKKLEDSVSKVGKVASNARGTKRKKELDGYAKYLSNTKDKILMTGDYSVDALLRNQPIGNRVNVGGNVIRSEADLRNYLNQNPQDERMINTVINTLRDDLYESRRSDFGQFKKYRAEVSEIRSATAQAEKLARRKSDKSTIRNESRQIVSDLQGRSTATARQQQQDAEDAATAAKQRRARLREIDKRVTQIQSAESQNNALISNAPDRLEQISNTIQDLEAEQAERVLIAQANRQLEDKDEYRPLPGRDRTEAIRNARKQFFDLRLKLAQARASARDLSNEMARLAEERQNLLTQ